MIGNYYSEYGETVIIQPNLFIECNNSVSDPYLITSSIVKKTSKKLYVISFIGDTRFIGKFGQIDYICGIFTYKQEHFHYFAYYFSCYDKNNLFEVCVPTEKDLNKYTFCIKTSVCEIKPVDELKHIINVIKTNVPIMTKTTVDAKN